MYSFNFPKKSTKLTNHPQPPPPPQQTSKPQPQPEPSRMILTKNQNRHTFSIDHQERITNPKNNMIDLYQKINSNINCNKTIVHVLDNSNGFGDFLRGSILLAQYAKYFNINFKMDVSRHNISKYLLVEPELLSTTEPIHFILFRYLYGEDIKMYSMIEEFINSNKPILYITTNLYYNIDLVFTDIKEYINSFFTFKQKYYDMATELFNLDTYNVLHIRSYDVNFNSNFYDLQLLNDITKLQLPENTIVMSNNYNLKIELNKLFGFYFIDKLAHHTASVSDYTELESTIIEYIILSKSSRTHCFSYYHHGSGFSEQCSVLNDIPYHVVYLYFTFDNKDVLLNPYQNLLDTMPIRNVIKKPKKYENIYHNNISFITLTNTGYVDYTLNCLKSLKNIGMKTPLKSYCIGEEGYSILKNTNCLCEYINDDPDASAFQEFRTNNWSNITYYKFEIIYNNLLNNEYVCITDGDIVYENNTIFDYLLDNMGDNDLLCQSDDNDICSGFMFIKSNENTRLLFNPTNVKHYKNIKGWDDQIYINLIKYKFKFKKLPLCLFPTGKYYFVYHKNIKPYLIHFNWTTGHEKRIKMVEYNKWYISKKVKICQYGTDGFGHQLEGMLRLLSLSLNNHADYQYDYRKEYVFEHTNFNIDTLKRYITEALNIISNKTDENEDGVDPDNTVLVYDKYNVILREQRTIYEIVQNDKNIENTIYCYDGVSSNIPNRLPPNFEANHEIEKSLPKLREAFVEKNRYLPKPSYDNQFINVCCHISLGDAIGQRILDTDNLFKAIKEFQKYNQYRIIIHTNGNVNHLKSENTIIYNGDTDVLQVLSDFIYADIFIMNYSSLSIAAHFLADNRQNVICPTNAGPTFNHRILNKCITTSELLTKKII